MQIDKEYIVNIYRELHQIPEIGFDLPKTVAKVMEELRSYVDAMEPLTASEYWPMPNYGDLMFSVK